MDQEDFALVPEVFLEVLLELFCALNQLDVDER